MLWYAAHSFVYTLYYTYSPYNFLAGPLLSCTLIIHSVHLASRVGREIHTQFILYLQPPIANVMLSELLNTFKVRNAPCH